MCASSTSGCAFVCFTVQCCIGYSNSISIPGCPEASIKEAPSKNDGNKNENN